MADKLNALAKAPVNALNSLYDLYQRRVGQPFQQAVRGGVRGYFGLPMMSDADSTGRQAYRQGEALGYTPGVGMPAGAVRLAAEGVQALPSIAGDIGRVIAGMPSGAGAAQVEDFARYQRSIPPSDVSPLTAFHGTPHRFEPTPANPLGEFRAAKIGSGEGAQAYGYGLYFAESPGVAKGYQAALSGYSADGKRLPSDIGTVVSSYKGDVTAAIADRQRQLDKWLARKDQLGERVGANVVKGIQDEIKKLSALQGKRLESTGSLYTVDIPDEMIGKMLDWDKPLKDQPSNVKKALEPLAKQLAEDRTISLLRAYRAAGLNNNQTPKRIIKADDIKGNELYEFATQLNKKPEPKPSWTSVSVDTDTRAWSGQQATSAYLKDLGIPGIRYFDMQSRDVKEGTRNIVVFPGEESKVKILKRE